jgi:uncharacterized protein (TIGR03435 family)
LRKLGLTIALLLMLAPPLHAQTPVAALTFDVVSIRPTKIASDRQVVESQADGDGITITNMSAGDLIQIAYDFRRRELIIGLPEWAASESFDVTAKVADANIAAFRKLNQAQRRQMLQPILASRFQLKAHIATKQLPIYALVVGRNGPKLKQARPGDTYPGGSKLGDGSPAGPGTLIGLTGQGVTMAALAAMLSRIDLGREVVDRTGLTGKYDFRLRCAPTDAMRPVINGHTTPLSTDEEALPSIFTALQEQLGLKLESNKAAVEVLVVDHIERPSED